MACRPFWRQAIFRRSPPLLPCEFQLLTSAADAPIIVEHPAWQKLQSICQVKIVPIDDLITGDNHTTTITLAFSRAVRAAGAQMVDTCFINLCADYLFSDHALENVMKRMNAGASAVLAGNFQIVAEDGLGALRRKIDPTRVELPISARELIRCGITYIHPATVANIVNFGLFHNEHTNRLFWRVDDSTLIGRFYLLHVVCIRPEVTEFVTGSSFDYSFVPELCPSNKVDVITDSDDYFVLELQTRNHEADQLRPGPLETTDLAVSLAEWTTARHRENARSTVVFHAEEIPRHGRQGKRRSRCFHQWRDGGIDRPAAAAPEPSVLDRRDHGASESDRSAGSLGSSRTRTWCRLEAAAAEHTHPAVAFADGFVRDISGPWRVPSLLA